MNHSHASQNRSHRLQNRAQELARPLEKQTESLEGIEVIQFQLAEEQYALELEHIQEIRPLGTVTPLPSVPDFIRGIIAVRGKILSVVDLRPLFELPQSPSTSHTKVILLSSSDMEFGLLAEEIHGMRFLASEELQSSLPTLTGIREKFLRAVTPEGLVILDGSRLLSDSNLVIDQQG